MKILALVFLPFAFRFPPFLHHYSFGFLFRYRRPQNGGRLANLFAYFIDDLLMRNDFAALDHMGCNSWLDLGRESSQTQCIMFFDLYYLENILVG